MKLYKGDNPYKGLVLGAVQAALAAVLVIPKAVIKEGVRGIAPGLRVALLGLLGKPLSWMLMDSRLGAESRLR